MGKRAVDVSLGLVLAILATPVIVIAAGAAGIALRAWPLFVQRRVGQDGRIFRMIKIRTMPASAPRYTDKRSLDAVPIPALGHWMRVNHIDELPQLWLVPFGRMSLVGPRPEMPQLHAEMDPHFATVRTSVRPGCTGIWQVSVDAGHLIGEDPEYDEFYVANADVRLDLWVLWRTALSLVHRGEPVTLRMVADDAPAAAVDLRDPPAVAERAPYLGGTGRLR